MANEVYAPVESYPNRQLSMYNTEPLHVAITRGVLLKSSDLLIKPKLIGFIIMILHHVYDSAVE
jgi:hypothetical protein